jgi:hypothetical protein
MKISKYHLIKFFIESYGSTINVEDICHLFKGEIPIQIVNALADKPGGELLRNIAEARLEHIRIKKMIAMEKEKAWVERRETGNAVVREQRRQDKARKEYEEQEIRNNTIDHEAINNFNIRLQEVLEQRK